jgi:hypothetical protein
MPARDRALKPGGGRGGMGPILRIGENDKAPTRYRPPDWLNTDATFLRAQFCKPQSLIVEPAGGGWKIHGTGSRDDTNRSNFPATSGALAGTLAAHADRRCHRCARRADRARAFGADRRHHVVAATRATTIANDDRYRSGTRGHVPTISANC